MLIKLASGKVSDDRTTVLSVGVLLLVGIKVALINTIELLPYFLLVLRQLKPQRVQAFTLNRVQQERTLGVNLFANLILAKPYGRWHTAHNPHARLDDSILDLRKSQVLVVHGLALLVCL